MPLSDKRCGMRAWQPLPREIRTIWSWRACRSLPFTLPNSPPGYKRCGLRALRAGRIACVELRVLCLYFFYALGLLCPFFSMHLPCCTLIPLYAYHLLTLLCTYPAFTLTYPLHARYLVA